VKKSLLASAIVFFGLQPFTLNAMSLEEAINMPHREGSSARDEYRHPLQTLEFFDVEPDMTVVEIWPGQGWYTEILAPYLKDEGKFYAAHFDEDSKIQFFHNSRAGFKAKLKQSPALYSQVHLAEFTLPDELTVDEPVDRILTFRNIHNWYMNGGGEARVEQAFKAFYEKLKPGGVLGVVEHRLPPERSAQDQEKSGYMLEKDIIRLAEAAGFKLDGKSEINSNKKDTADYEQGVWTLPPTLRLGEQDRDHYLSIGESDRMTLRFVK
tara:strand:+ start:1009 stop:1809 length:801 start_codon:yes stop_codon:yes gene_type:complete